MTVRRLLPLATLLAAALLAGCGGDDPPPRALAPVRLTIDAPADSATVDSGSVEVSGRVWPLDARVLVAGDEAAVEAGRFRAAVDLDAGANVIDVQAAAPRRAAAMDAVRVTRRMPVEIPELSGTEPEEAVRQLRALGLEAGIEDAGGLLDGLLPGEPAVCETSPAAGERVRPGTKVAVRVARSC